MLHTLVSHGLYIVEEWMEHTNTQLLPEVQILRILSLVCVFGFVHGHGRNLFNSSRCAARRVLITS